MTVDPEWINPSSDPGAVRRLVAELDCSHVLRSVLATRGATDPAAADRWLSPSTEDIHDPGGFEDLDPAVDRLASAFTGGEFVLVYADGDVDGVTGCAALRPLLADLGAIADSHIPGEYGGTGRPTKRHEQPDQTTLAMTPYPTCVR